jgi:hypothetical protein
LERENATQILANMSMEEKRVLEGAVNELREVQNGEQPPVPLPIRTHAYGPTPPHAIDSHFVLIAC